MLSEKTGFETKSIDRLNNRLRDGGEISNNLRKLIMRRRHKVLRKLAQIWLSVDVNLTLANGERLEGKVVFLGEASKPLRPSPRTKCI